MFALAALSCALAFTATPSAADPNLVEVRHTDGPEVVENEFVVMFKKESTQDARDSHMTKLKTALLENSNADLDMKVTHEWDITGQNFRGYGVKCTRAVLDAHVLTDIATVDYAEASQVYRTSCNVQREATWGLVRVSERDLLLDGIFTYESHGGSEVVSYVIDTGIYTEHSDFGGRAKWGTDTVDSPSPETDENGHGTHVAGTMISETWGIAKKGTTYAVKVLGRNGSGSTAGVIAGVAWAANHCADQSKPCVSNMSLGGGFSSAQNAAVAAGTAKGNLYVVASGNSNANACLYSPASEPTAFTINSSDNRDYRSSFSNYGTCTDAFAPGSSITSTWIGGQYATNTISGTSMASPHAAGVAMMHLHENPNQTPAQAIAAITQQSTPNKIVSPGTGSPNLLVFHECAGEEAKPVVM